MAGIIRLYLTIEMYKLFKRYFGDDELIIMNFEWVKIMTNCVFKVTKYNCISLLFF